MRCQAPRRKLARRRCRSAVPGLLLTLAGDLATLESPHELFYVARCVLGFRPAEGRASFRNFLLISQLSTSIFYPLHDLVQASDAGSGGNGAASSAASAAAAAAAPLEPGLLLPTGGAGAWDEAGLGHPVVRYYLGDDEQRWFMWYSGRSASCQDLDEIFPSSGSIGEQAVPLCSHGSENACVEMMDGIMEPLSTVHTGSRCAPAQSSPSSAPLACT